MANFRYIDPDDANRDPFASDEGKSEFESMLETSQSWVTTRRFKVGESISGKVMSVGQEFVFVDLGGKVAGAIALDEYRNSDSGVVPSVGDDANLFVREDNGSEVILTRSLRRSEADDVMLRTAFEEELPIDAKVEKAIKGGFEVSVGSRRGFVPMGAMDIVPIDDPEKYIGKVLKFVIQTFSGRNLVLSRKSLLREEQQERVREVLGTLEVGQSKRATITRLATFGAFADIGGVEGLVPMSELSWSRVKSVEDVVKVGEVVQVKIIKIEHAPKLKIGLTLKGAGEDPWVSMATRLMPGSVMEGTITRLADFGAFVAISDGVEGLVHVSQLTWERRVNHPREVIHEGDKVAVHVLTVDLENHKLGLSIKGPMPADMATRLDAKRRSRQDLSADELAMSRDWDEYQKSMANAPKSRPEDTSTFAAAFAKARNRK